ncbi:hypothetical protein PN459_21510 [Microcystis aeruginosa CS-567/02-A1]|nr:hypothetical protein [Microcystis aeruginosa CS-567/02-A1]
MNRAIIASNSNSYLLADVSYSLRSKCQEWGVNLFFVDDYPSPIINSCCCVFYENVRDILLIKADILLLQTTLNCSFTQAANVALIHELGHFILFISKSEQSEEVAWLEGSRLLHLSNTPVYLYQLAANKYCNSANIK